MRKRTLARELAVQVLYKIDVTHEAPVKALEDFWSGQEKVSQLVRDFTSRLVEGVIEHKEKIDKEISLYAQNWKLERIAVVDRNILRIGLFELLYCEDIPPKVSINEAIDLAKKYSGLEAGKFVNGVLDKIRSEHSRSI